MTDIARLIDHTLLKPEAGAADIHRHVKEAVLHRFAAVCVNGRWVALVARLLREAGADFVKTSTGFHAKGGATEEAARWLVRYGAGMKVKASGGIRDRAAERYVALGAVRIGTSAGVGMMGD